MRSVRCHTPRPVPESSAALPDIASRTSSRSGCARLVRALEKIKKDVSLLGRRPVGCDRVVAVRQLTRIVDRLDPAIVRIAVSCQIVRGASIETEARRRSVKCSTDVIDGGRIAAELVPLLEWNRDAVGDGAFKILANLSMTDRRRAPGARESRPRVRDPLPEAERIQACADRGS